MRKIYFKSVLKFSFLTLAILFFVSSGNSQDLLVKANGDTIAIKVIEIQEFYLLYYKTELDEERKFTTARSRLNKIIYTDGKEFVFAEEIFGEEEDIEELIMAKEKYRSESLRMNSGIFAPSIYRNSEKLSNVEVESIYEDHPQALRLFKKGRSTNILGNLLALPSGFIFGNQLSKTLFFQEEANVRLLLGSGFAGILSVILNKNGVGQILESTKVYNTSINTDKEVSLEFKLTPHGAGLVFSF